MKPVCHKERPPFELPVVSAKDRMNLKIWEERIWRASNGTLTKLLTDFWQEAYGHGLSDMDKMHGIIDFKTEINETMQQV